MKGIFITLGASIAFIIICVLVRYPGNDRGDERNELVLITPSGTSLPPVLDAVKRFEAKFPDWRVRVISTPGKDYYVKSLSLMAAGAQLDVLWLGLGFGMFADRGALLELDSFIEADPELSHDMFLEQALDMYRVNGRLYGLPYGIDLQGFVINIDMLKRNGLPIPDETWTVSDFLDIGRKTTRNGRGSERVYGLGMDQLPMGLWGISLLNKEGTQFTLKEDRTPVWLNTSLALADEGVLLRSAGSGQMNRLNEFVAGRVAVMELKSWEFNELKGMTPFEWKLLPPPQNEEGDQYAWASSSGFCISSSTQYPEMALELVKELTNADFQQAMKHRTVPVLKEVYAEYTEEQDERLQAIELILPQVRHDPRIRHWEQVSGEIRYWMDKIYQRQISADEGVNTVEIRVQRILDKQ